MKASQSDINFAKQVAEDYGHQITTEEAIRAIEVCFRGDEDDYYRLKEYFLN